jgi:hypothetical protein
LEKAEKGIAHQLKLLKATNSVITSNLISRADGAPAARQLADDTGIAVYFDYNGERHCRAIDRYKYFWENMRAIEKNIEAIRGLERWGGAEIVKTSLGGFKELPAQAIVTPYTAKPWHEVLEVSPNASKDASYRGIWKD